MLQKESRTTEWKQKWRDEYQAQIPYPRFRPDKSGTEWVNNIELMIFTCLYRII